MKLERLENTPLCSVLQEILTDRQTGVMTVVSDGGRRSLYWSQGELVLLLSENPKDSFEKFLIRKGVLPAEGSAELAPSDPSEIVMRAEESERIPAAQRHSLLREWTTSLAVPLFSLDAGTVAFSEEDALEPEKRVFISTAAVVIEAIRQISSGLVLRAAIGDPHREVEPNPAPHSTVDTLPLTAPEREIASSLRHRQTISELLQASRRDSAMASRVVVAMLTLGVWLAVEPRASEESFEDTEKDLALLASIGGDPRAFQAVALAKQLPTLDHYQFLDLPRAATRGQIITHSEDLRRRFDPASFPPAVQEAIRAILRRIDEAVETLGSADRRASYDTILGTSEDTGTAAIQKQVARRHLARQNYRKADELATRGDYYGAIVLLQQAVKFAPHDADSWHLLGLCQQHNPRWRRRAVDSLQRALSIDPNRIETLIALGDLHVSQRMLTRARAFFEDALKIDPENQVATAKLKALGR